LMMEGFSVIGKRLPRVDGRAKATGEAIYTLDIHLPHMLHGKILRSPHPHARILHIDTTRAERLAGVRGVVTAKDISSEKRSAFCYGAILPDEYPLAFDRVRFIGDEVAAVAAVDEECAQEALELIRVEYELLPSVFDPEEAIKEGAVQLHDHAKKNISWRLYQDLGDVDRGLRDADHIQEDRFITQLVSHAPLEPHAAVTQFNSDGRLTVWTSTQRPFFVAWDLACALGIPESKVRVIKPHVGGGFGGKIETSSVEFSAAFLSRKTGHPVKIVLTRDEEFFATRRRHAFIIHLKTGVKRDGTITARFCRSLLDGGAYNSLGIVTCYLSSIFLHLPYKNPNVRYEAIRVYTNKPPCGAMRGFGSPQMHFAIEVQMDMIAEAIGIDPMELRLRNRLRAGDETSSGLKIKSCGLRECIQSSARLSGWEEKRKRGGKGVGIGMACNGFLSGPRLRRLPRLADAYAFSSSLIRAHADGNVTLITGSADIGQGSDSVLAQIVAEELGIPYECVAVLSGDTEIAPLDLGTYGSRVTMMAGNATRNAAKDLKKKIFNAVAERFEVNPGDFELKNGFIFIEGSPDKNLPFSEAVVLCQQYLGGRPVIGEGFYNPEEEGKLDIQALCERGEGNYSPTYSFGAQVAEVEVDRQSGEVRVQKMTVAHDCGKAINPMAVEGQLEGSVAMGLGYSLTEEVKSEDGLMMNPSFLDYKVPLSLDVPPIEIIQVDSHDPVGPFGAKESGEGTASPTAPAIINAIHHATGVWLKELPVTPEKLLKAMEESSKDSGKKGMK
jgi:4-hydroxybenzoyl-CoA reductase subunit alpha